MKPMVPRKRAFYFFSFIVVFIVVIPFIVLYSLGYSLTKEYALTERGGLYVFAPESGSKIYVGDDLKKETSTFQKELFLQNLKPDTYLVLVANDAFWPWAKYVEVKEREVSPLYPFLVPREITVREIVKATTTTASVRPGKDEYTQVTALFAIATSTKPLPASAMLPSAISSTSTKLIADDAHAIVRNKMKIWSKGSEVFAQWIGNEGRIPPYFCVDGVCKATTTVFSAAVPVRHIAFYPGRDDAIILSVGNGVFATEIDTRQYHNFFPLYKGVAPDFRIGNDEIYIKDGVFVGELLGL